MVLMFIGEEINFNREKWLRSEFTTKAQVNSRCNYEYPEQRWVFKLVKT